jgi:glycosyltransferase involved in cell wall biosynthesis
MKVLYVLPKPGFFAEGPRGRVTHATGVATGLAENGVPILVMSGKGTKEQFSKLSLLIEVEQIEGRQGSLLGALSWTRKFLRRIREILRAHEDITHVLVRYAVSNAAFFIPLVKRFSNHTWIMEVNSLAFHQLDWLPAFIGRAYFTFERWILDQADFVYVVSQALKDDLVQGHMVLPTEKVVVVPNGGPESLADRVAARPTDAPIRFVYLGLFHSYYELPLAIDAFRETQNSRAGVELHLYGDGPNRTALEHHARGMVGVYFHGRFDLESLLENGQITENDVLVLPYAPCSLARIGSPMKLYEYMALGLPMITSAIGQIREILKDGRTAKFYKPGDKKALARAMMCLADNPQARSQLIANIRAEYSNRHTWKARMSKLASYMGYGANGR